MNRDKPGLSFANIRAPVVTGSASVVCCEQLAATTKRLHPKCSGSAIQLTLNKPVDALRLSQDLAESSERQVQHAILIEIGARSLLDQS